MSDWLPITLAVTAWLAMPLWLQLPDWIDRWLHRRQGHTIRYLGNWADENVYQCSCGEFFDAWSPT